MQVEAQERVKQSKTDEQTDEKALVQEELSKIMLNPNVFTDFKLAGTQEVRIQIDFENALLPSLSSNLVCELDMSFAVSEVGVLNILGDDSSVLGMKYSCLCFPWLDLPQ